MNCTRLRPQQLPQRIRDLVDATLDVHGRLSLIGSRRGPVFNERVNSGRPTIGPGGVTHLIWPAGSRALCTGVVAIVTPKSCSYPICLSPRNPEPQPESSNSTGLNPELLGLKCLRAASVAIDDRLRDLKPNNAPISIGQIYHYRFISSRGPVASSTVSCVCDALPEYLEPVEQSFGPVTGSPDMELVSTRYVERLNTSTWLHMRRRNRMTLAFSKKLENFEEAVALHLAYSVVEHHNSLRSTPAMAAGVECDF